MADQNSSSALATVGRAAVVVFRVPGLLIRAALLGLLWVYQNLVSPLLGPRCRYYPSCSSYAVGALHIHGAAKGTVLAVARVGRCHPWSAGGLDPVPPRGHWRPAPEPVPESEPHPDVRASADVLTAAAATAEPVSETAS